MNIVAFEKEGINLENKFSNRLKIIRMIVPVLVSSVIITGCQASLSENTIKSAFDQYVFPIGENVEIGDIEVLRRSSEDKEDISLCQVEAIGEVATYTAYFSVEYKYYDKGGWILENIDLADTDEWTATYNETGIKTVDDASEDVDILCDELPVEQEYLTLTWEEDNTPRRVNTDADGEQLAQVFNGTATYKDDFCTINAPFKLLYFFDVSWQDNTFIAYWFPAYNYSRLLEDVNNCVSLDLSGTWIGDSPYGAPLVLTLDMDENGYPYGNLEFEVPADNYSHYPPGVKHGGVIDFGCSDIAHVNLGYDNYWAAHAFDLRGEGNKNYNGYGNDWVYLQNLVLNINDKTLTGRYWRSYGTDFDVVLTWQDR